MTVTCTLNAQAGTVAADGNRPVTTFSYQGQTSGNQIGTLKRIAAYSTPIYQGLYDGRVVVQERDASNLPLVSYTRGNDLSGDLQGVGASVACSPAPTHPYWPLAPRSHTPTTTATGTETLPA